jgi:hypothetical protein
MTRTNAQSRTPDDTATTPSCAVEVFRRALFVTAVAFLAFVAGGVTIFLDIQPVTGYVQKTAMVAVYVYKSNIEGEAIEPFWHRAHLSGPEGENAVILNTSGASPGLNLVIESQEQAAKLITMDGRPVHEWRLRFDEIWTDPPHVPSFREQGPAFWMDKVHWRRAHLYPNGDLLVVFGSPFHTPYGFGMVKLDRESRVIWKFSENAHHDAAVAPDGDIYVLNQRINRTGYAGIPDIEPPFIDDMVTAMAADGTKIKDISLVQAFLDSDYSPALWLLGRNLQGDITHVNTVQYIDDELAAAFDFAQSGDLLISMREMDLIAVLDPREERIVWARTGLWRAQHEPQMLANGRIQLFDNKGHRGPEGMTRVIEFDPNTGGITWTYAGTENRPLVSAIYAAQQRLSNGNTLIVETNNGRAIEVTRAGDIVWEYRSTYRKTAESGAELVALLTDLVRIDPGSITFLDRRVAQVR